MPSEKHLFGHIYFEVEILQNVSTERYMYDFNYYIRYLHYNICHKYLTRYKRRRSTI